MTSALPVHRYEHYTLVTVLFVTDRICKALALSGMAYGRPGTFEFVLFQNQGIAFSIPFPTLLYWIAVTTLFIALVEYFTRLYRANNSRALFAFLVIAGATSNMLDRAIHEAVTDYIVFFSRSAVNIADAMIVLGLLMLVRAPRTPAPVSATETTEPKVFPSPRT